MRSIENHGLCPPSTINKRPPCRNSESVRRCRGSRTRASCAAAAAMSTTSCCRAWRSAMCCARRTPMRGFARSTLTRRGPRPGVLAVLTGADWVASGWGDLPVPGGMKRRDGSADVSAALSRAGDRSGALGRRLRRLRGGRNVSPGGRRRRADRGRLRAAAGRRLDRRCGGAGRAARLGRLSRTTSASSIATAITAATDAAFAGAAHVVRGHFVVNRVTAVTMEPRGSIGDYNAADGRYTIYTTLQRAHPFRAELAHNVLKVPGEPRAGRRAATSAAASA